MIDKRKLAHDLTDLMARLLHYQQHGEPDIATLTYAEAVRVPGEIVARYRNEPIFHAQVQRAVASVLHLVTDAERDAVRVTGSADNTSDEAGREAMTFRNLTEPGPVCGTMQCPACGTWHMGAHYCPGLPRYGDGRHYGSLTEDDVRRIVHVRPVTREIWDSPPDDECKGATSAPPPSPARSPH